MSGINGYSSSTLAEFDVGTWVVALAFVLAFRLGRLASQEAYNLPQSPMADAIGSPDSDRRTDHHGESGEKPGRQDGNALQTEIAEAVQKTKREAEKRKQEQEAYARAAQQEAEIARLQQEKARREYLEQQARLAAEIKERQGREMEIIREQRESEAVRLTELQRQEEEERNRQVAKRLEQQRAAAVAKQKAAEERKNVRRALWRCDSEMRVQARLVPLIQSDKKLFVQRDLIPMPVKCFLRISCRITNNGRLLTQEMHDIPVVSEEEASCLEYIGPGIAACVRAMALRSQDLEDKAADSLCWADERADWAALISIVTAVYVASAPLQGASYKESYELRCPVVSLQRWQEQERLNADSEQWHHNVTEDTIARAFPLCRIIQAGLTSAAEFESDFRELALAEQEILKDFCDHALELLSEPTICGFIAAALAAGRVVAALPVHDSIDLTPVANQIGSIASTCTSDSLQVPCALLAAALGPDHPLKPILESIAETNLSAAARHDQEEQRRTALKSLAERLEKQEDVGRDQDELLDSLPVPDRIWILITVAKSLEEEPGSLGLARRLAETALTVKGKWASISNMQHPCLLPELLVLESILQRDRKWHRDAAGLAGLILRTSMNLADDYVRAGDPLSALLLIEGAQHRFSKVLTPGHQSLKSAMRTSQELQHRLPAEELKLLPGLRRDVCPGILATLSSRLKEPSTYDPAMSRTPPTKDSRINEWSSKGIRMLGRLH